MGRDISTYLAWCVCAVRRRGWFRRRCFRVPARQHAEEMCYGVGFVARGAERRATEQLFAHRHDLFTDENAEEPDERDEWRCRRAHVKQAVDDADQQAGTE